MCLEEAQETDAKLGLWDILMMEMKMSKHYARGCLGILWKVPPHQESWAVRDREGGSPETSQWVKMAELEVFTSWPLEGPGQLTVRGCGQAFHRPSHHVSTGTKLKGMCPVSERGKWIPVSLLTQWTCRG